MFKYSVNMSWSDEDDCYVAIIPEFPYLSAFGDTPEEAAEEAKIAAEGIIAVMHEDGDTVPEPQKHKSYSGQTRLRMPVTLHERLSTRAALEKVSFNTYVVALLEGKSAREEAFFEAHKSLKEFNNAFIEKAEKGFSEIFKITAEKATENFQAFFGIEALEVPGVERCWGSPGFSKGDFRKTYDMPFTNQ